MPKIASVNLISISLMKTFCGQAKKERYKSREKQTMEIIEVENCSLTVGGVKFLAMLVFASPPHKKKKIKSVY